jgi:hypothetical protein
MATMKFACEEPSPSGEGAVTVGKDPEAWAGLQGGPLSIAILYRVPWIVFIEMVQVG